MAFFNGRSDPEVGIERVKGQVHLQQALWETSSIFFGIPRKYGRMTLVTTHLQSGMKRTKSSRRASSLMAGSARSDDSGAPSASACIMLKLTCTESGKPM